MNYNYLFSNVEKMSDMVVADNNYIEMLNKSDKKVEDLYISESSFKTDTYNVYIKYKKES